MKRMKAIHIILGLAMTVAIAANAARNADGMAVGDPTGGKPMETPSMLKVGSINLEHVGEKLSLTFDINPKKVCPSSNRQVVFTPVIRSTGTAGGDSVELAPLTIAGRNRYYSHIRNGRIAAGNLIYPAGHKDTIKYRCEVAWADWMGSSYIYMREETKDCCKPVKPLCNTPIADINTMANTVTNAIESVDYIALTGDSTVEMEMQGSAFIDFKVNNTEIFERYRGNQKELKKIIESIDLIKNDPDAIITQLSIKGFASPEGSYDNNVRLAMGRTEALKEYVRKKCDFDPEILMTSYEAEDWDGLRRWLENSTLPHHDEIIAVVDSDLSPDSKDEAIKKRFPKEYKVLLDSVYPSLRHSDYKIRYKIRTYADIEELKQVYQNAPERLRPVDFYRVAQTYPEGSNEFEEVLLKASEIYPHDEQAAINAANILMNRGQTAEASDKLIHAGESGEAYYSRGLLATINEDNERAERFFRKAVALGNTDAIPYLQRAEQNHDRESVIFLINSEK